VPKCVPVCASAVALEYNKIQPSLCWSTTLGSLQESVTGLMMQNVNRTHENNFLIKYSGLSIKLGQIHRVTRLLIEKLVNRETK
jgi:hypothetical protein